jgi:hypothetical protein
VAVLGFVLRALCLLGRCCTIRVMPQTIFALVILGIGSHFMHRPAWTSNFLLVFPCVAGITGVFCHAQPLVEMGYQELFALANLKL